MQELVMLVIKADYQRTRTDLWIEEEQAVEADCSLQEGLIPVVDCLD